MTPAVVKLGGSSANSATLPDWLAAIKASTRPLVLVPGGGPFADRIRDSQRALGFSDEAAHAMALLAMEQFGHVLIDRAPRLRPARSMDEMRALLSEYKIPVWFPSQMALSEPAIPASWDVTSDSLAAWLAGKMNAEALLLIKQTDDFSESDDVASLTTRGIVDRAFPQLFPSLCGPANRVRRLPPPLTPLHKGERLGVVVPRKQDQPDSHLRPSLLRGGVTGGGSTAHKITLHLAGPRHLPEAATIFAKGLLPGRIISNARLMQKAG